MVHQFERTSYLRLPNTFGGFCYPFPLHTFFFMIEVEDETCASEDEEKAGFPREGLWTI